MNATAQPSSLPGELASKLVAHAPTWIMGLVILLLGLRAAPLVVDLAGPSTDAGLATGLPAPPASRKVVDIPAIVRANLFGQSAPLTGTDAPVTTMNLKLVLVLAANDPKRGLAALGPNLNDVKVYQVGDEVPGGAHLNAVYVDRVLLDRGGSIEALLLPPREGLPPPTAGPLPTAVNPAASVERVQQVMRENPSLINQVMTRQAVFADGHLRGMRVNPGSNAQAFAKLGLKPGDIVTAINGTPLDDQTRSNEIFNTLNSSAQARVTVNRGGHDQELTLNLADIANEAERLADAPPQNMPPPPPPPAEPDSGPDSTR